MFIFNKLKYICRYFLSLGLQLIGLTDKSDLFLHEKYTTIREAYGPTCLDVGCGYADFAHFLIQEGNKVTGIDIVDQCRHDEVPTSLFNGVDIAFEDNSFDTSIVMFALHHAKDQEALLDEVARVTRHHIIIAEDIIEKPFDQLLANFHLHTSLWSKGKDAFHSHTEWLEIFSSHGLQVIKSHLIPRYKEPIYPVARRVYILTPS